MTVSTKTTPPAMTGYDPAEHLTVEGFFRPMRPLGEVIDAYQTASARKQEELAARLWEEFLHSPVGIQGLRDTGEHDKADLYEAERLAYQEWFRSYRIHILELTDDPQLDEGYGYDALGRDMWGWDEEGWAVVFGADEDEAIHCFTEDTRDPAGYDFWGFDEEGVDRLGYTATAEEQEPGSSIYFYRDGRTVDGFDRGGFNRKKWSRAASSAMSNRQGVGEGSIHQDTDTIYDPEGYTVEWGEGFWQRARDKDGYKRNGYHYRTNLDREGYDPEGYDAEGYDAEGYDRAGFSRAGIHRVTGTKFDTYHLDKDGYDSEGFKAYRNPLNGKVKLLRRDGYSKSGTDIEGYNRKGIKNGFSKFTLLHEGTKTYFDESGRNINRLDSESKDRWGNQPPVLVARMANRATSSWWLLKGCLLTRTRATN